TPMARTSLWMHWMHFTGRRCRITDRLPAAREAVSALIAGNVPTGSCFCEVMFCEVKCIVARIMPPAPLAWTVRRPLAKLWELLSEQPGIAGTTPMSRWIFAFLFVFAIIFTAAYMLMEQASGP